MAHLVFLRFLVRNHAGFVFLAGHLVCEEGFGLFEFLAVLVGLLVLGVVEVGVVFFLGILAFQGRRELGQEDIVGVSVKNEVVEIGHQAQFPGRLDDREPVERSGEVEGLHEGFFEVFIVIFAAELDGRNLWVRFSGHQIDFSVFLLQPSGNTGMSLQNGQQGLFKGRYLRAFREGEDERQVVGRGGRIPDAIQVQTGLLEGEFLGFVLRAFRFGRLVLVLGQEEVKDVVFYALQAGRLGKAVHIRLQPVALVQLGGQAEGSQRRQAAVIQGVRKAEASDAHGLLDDAADLFFQHVERGHVGLRLVFLGLRFGQGLYIHLLVYVEGDGVYLHGNRRHHVRGFLAGDELVQLLDVDLLGAHDVGCQELAGAHAGLVKGLHRHILDVREFPNDGLHFLELDAETADLDLAVLSAHKFYLSVFPLTDDVSGSVGRGVIGVLVKRVLHKRFGRFVGPVEVTQTHLPAGNPEFSRFSLGNLLAVFDNVYLDVLHRPADGDVLFLLFHLFVYHVADGFRGAVAVEEAVVRQREAGHLFSAGIHSLEALAVRIVDGELGGHLGGHKAARDAVLFKEIVQGGQVEADFFRNDVEGSAADQGAVQVRHEGVEAKAGVSGDMGGVVQAHQLAVMGAVGINVPVAEHAALGRTGGSAGVQQDKQVFRLGLRGLGRAGMQFADVGGLQDRPLVLLQDGQELLIGHQHLGARIFHHETEAFRRVRRVQREIGAPGLERTQRGQHHMLVAAQHDAHNALGGHFGFYIGGKVVRQPVYFGIA